MTRNPVADEGPSIHVTVRGGHISDDVREYTERKMRHLAHYSGRPVRHGDVVLSLSGDPARHDSVAADATLDVDGTGLHATANATTAHAAVDEVVERLQRQVVELGERRHEHRPAH
jgi:ribosomal subunit interface protein